MSEAALAPVPSLRARVLTRARSPEPAELAGSTGTRIRAVPVNVCAGGVALLRRQRAPRLLLYSDVGGEWPDSAIRWRCTDGGGITRRRLSSARVCMVASYMQRVRERAFGTPTSKPVGVTAQAAAAGASACVEDHPKCRCVSRTANLRRGVVVLQRCQFASLEAREDGAERHSMSRLPGNCESMVRQQRAPIFDALSFLDRGVAEWPDHRHAGSAASALDSWRKYSPVYTRGDIRADPQFRVLAFVVRRAHGWHLIPSLSVRSSLFISICDRGAKGTTCAACWRACHASNRRRLR